jgi:hypothetical protein
MLATGLFVLGITDAFSADLSLLFGNFSQDNAAYAACVDSSQTEQSNKLR